MSSPLFTPSYEQHRLILTSTHSALQGPAGSGKSTLCSSLIAHAQTLGRNIHLFNLDPAAEHFAYTPTIDIRELITLSDVMDEMKLGPNGGLVYCFEYLLENLDWLEDHMGSFEDDYLIIDCPGGRQRAWRTGRNLSLA